MTHQTLTELAGSLTAAWHYPGRGCVSNTDLMVHSPVVLYSGFNARKYVKQWTSLSMPINAGVGLGIRSEDAALTKEPQKLSLPILGMLIGMAFGVAAGIGAVFYLGIESALDQVCLVGISLLAFQLFGSTVGSAIGKKG